MTDEAGLETAAVEIMAAAIALYGAAGLADAVRVIEETRGLDGPGEHSHPHKCRCPQAGVWGATGKMPAGHHWRWCNREHTGGYLAHDPAPCAA